MKTNNYHHILTNATHFSTLKSDKDVIRIQKVIFFMHGFSFY